MSIVRKLLVLLILCVYSCWTLRCAQCGTYDCGVQKTKKECPYGIGKGICSCCNNRCLKGPGEACGGRWGFAGHCGDGLICTFTEPKSHSLKGNCTGK